MKKFYDAHAKWNEIDDDPMTFVKKTKFARKMLCFVHSFFVQ